MFTAFVQIVLVFLILRVRGVLCLTTKLVYEKEITVIVVPFVQFAFFFNRIWPVLAVIKTHKRKKCAEILYTFTYPSTRVVLRYWFLVFLLAMFRFVTVIAITFITALAMRLALRWRLVYFALVRYKLLVACQIVTKRTGERRMPIMSLV